MGLPVFQRRGLNNRPPGRRPRGPRLPQPLARTRKLRTPGPRSHVPKPNPIGRGECRTAAGQRHIQRDSEINTDKRGEHPGETHAERYQDRDKQVVETFAERGAGRGRDRLRYTRRPGGPGRGAPGTHPGAYTGPLPLHTPSASAAPTKPSYTSPEGRGSASAHHARKGLSRWCDGGSWGPLVAIPLRPSEPDGSRRPRACDPRAPEPTVETASGGRRRAGGAPSRGPGPAPPELPWFPGGQRRSPGVCGWPHHPVHSLSRSFRSWLGERGREGGETRRQVRWGQAPGGGRRSVTLKPFCEDCSPSEPQKKPSLRQSNPSLPGSGEESFRMGG